jgi:hypothetical protein
MFRQRQRLFVHALPSVYTAWLTPVEMDMKRFGLAVLLTVLALGPAMAEGTCQSRAIDKNGKPLADAALNSFVTKCARDACEPKAIGKNGKPLAGAAKASFMKKCESEA